MSSLPFSLQPLERRPSKILSTRECCLLRAGGRGRGRAPGRRSAQRKLTRKMPLRQKDPRAPASLHDGQKHVPGAQSARRVQKNQQLLGCRGFVRRQGGGGDSWSAITQSTGSRSRLFSMALGRKGGILVEEKRSSLEEDAKGPQRRRCSFSRGSSEEVPCCSTRHKALNPPSQHVETQLQGNDPKRTNQPCHCVPTTHLAGSPHISAAFARSSLSRSASAL